MIPGAIARHGMKNIPTWKMIITIINILTKLMIKHNPLTRYDVLLPVKPISSYRIHASMRFFSPIMQKQQRHMLGTTLPILHSPTFIPLTYDRLLNVAGVTSLISCSQQEYLLVYPLGIKEKHTLGFPVLPGLLRIPYLLSGLPI